MLFLSYCAAIVFWAIWNQASVSALEVNTMQLLQNLSKDYTNWIKSYYQCLMVFSWANLFV